MILALEKHAANNAVTSINNSSMQSEIWYYKFIIAFFRSISVIISNKIFLISAKGTGGALKAPPVAPGAESRKPKHF